MNIQWADPVANQQAAESALLSAEPSDIYVLPEMWSTGFATNPAGIAEDVASSSSLRWMQQMAQQLDAAIVGSLAIHADETYRNRMYFVTPDTVTYYDKHHLFSYGNEHVHYTAGNDRVVVEWRSVRFLLQVCYDLRFPCFSRNHLDNRNTGGDGIMADYDCIIYVASWPTSRLAVWNTLLKARALENQCYVLAVNRIGTDPACSYSGGTQAVDAYGKVMAACPDNESACITVGLDTAKLSAFRRKFPVLMDAD